MQKNFFSSIISADKRSVQLIWKQPFLPSCKQFIFIGRNIPAGFLILYKSIVSPPNLMKQNNRIFTARFIQFAMFISTLNNKFPCILCILVTKLITKIQVGTFIRQSSYNSGNDPPPNRKISNARLQAVVLRLRR